MDVLIVATNSGAITAKSELEVTSDETSMLYADKQAIIDNVVHRGLSVEDAASLLIIPKVVVETVSSHYRKFGHIPLLVHCPTPMMAVSGHLERAEDEEEEEEQEEQEEDELAVVEKVKTEPVNDDDDVIKTTDGFAVEPEMTPPDDPEPPITEETYVGEGRDRSGLCQRRISRRRKSLNRDEREELIRVARQCNAAAVRRLRSYASDKFHVDLPVNFIGSLLVQQNKVYTDGRNAHRFRNLHRTVLPADGELTDKLIRDQRLDLLKFVLDARCVTLNRTLKYVRDVLRVDASADAVRGFFREHGIEYEGESGDESDSGDSSSSPDCSRQSTFRCSDLPSKSVPMSERYDSLGSELGASSNPSSKKPHVTFSNYVRRTVVQLVCVNKMSHAQVSKLLGIPKGTVSTMIRVFKNSDRIEKVKQGGSHPKLTADQQSAVAKHVEDNPGLTTDRIRDYVRESFGVSVKRTTVQKVLKKHNLALRKTHESFVKYLNNEFAEEPREAETAKTGPKRAAKDAAKIAIASTGVEVEDVDETVGRLQKKKYTTMSNYTRHKIVEFVVRWGMSHSKVADLLGVPKGTVSGVVRCFQQNNRINKIKHGGAHCKLTGEHQAALVKYVAENEDATIKQAIDFVKQLSGKQVSKNLVYNVLRKHNLHKRRKGPVWPEWYLANKEHVVDLPPSKLRMVDGAVRSSKKKNGTTATTSSPSLNGKLRIITDDEASEHEMMATELYSHGNGPDASTDHRLNDGSLGGCGDHDKLPYGNYLDDQDSILLQHVHGLFAAAAASSTPPHVEDVKSTTTDYEESNAVDMPSTTANQVEVSTTPGDGEFGSASNGCYADSSLDRSVVDDSAPVAKGKQKKRYVPLSNMDRQRVISCVVHKGLSHSVVSKLFDIPRGTVSSIIRCFQKNSRIEKIRKGGSPSKLSNDQQRSMVEFHEQHGKLSIKHLQNYCHETFGISVSKSTVSLVLKRHSSPLKKKKSPKN